MRASSVDPMPVPFPTVDEVDLGPVGEAETSRLAAGVLSATRPRSGNTEFQRLLIEAIFEAMTGYRVDAASLPAVDARTYAQNLRYRDEEKRTRMVHMMVLSALVLRPTPPEVSTQVAEYSRELGIDDSLLRTIEQFASGDLAMAAADFERNGYTAAWSSERSSSLHTSTDVEGWAADEDDPTLAARWAGLGELPAGTLGRAVFDFYQARGFSFPGTPGSAPPLLAQHDWVHVLAGYGTKVEAELEVFALIARANDDPRGWSLLAMVVSLFETGYLVEGAGLFEAFPGQLSVDGMTVRIGDAMRRGALSHGDDGVPDVDFMQVDWFSYAAQPLEQVVERFGLPPKSERAIAAGSVTSWEPGGISEAQLAAGQKAASSRGVPYESHGASV